MNDCASVVTTVVTSILVYFPLLAFFAFGGVERLKIKDERERIFFRNEYGLSVERVVAESPVDRNKVLELKRSCSGGFGLFTTSENGIRYLIGLRLFSLMPFDRACEPWGAGQRSVRSRSGAAA